MGGEDSALMTAESGSVTWFNDVLTRESSQQQKVQGAMIFCVRSSIKSNSTRKRLVDKTNQLFIVRDHVLVSKVNRTR